MIICLACGNCTDSKYCEVCGMKLVSDENPDESFPLYEYHYHEDKKAETKNPPDKEIKT